MLNFNQKSAIYEITRESYNGIGSTYKKYLGGYYEGIYNRCSNRMR